MKTEEILQWAQAEGITIYGSRHNTSGKWSAVLGLHRGGEADTLLDAISQLKTNVESYRNLIKNS